MTVAGVSPTVRQRELGLRLRNLRTALDMTVEDVAKRLMCSPAKISRLETGARKPALRDVRDLCDIYKVGDPEASELMKLTREAREQGWWTQYEDLNLSPFIGLEQEASSITACTMYYIPGLVQTEEYAQAIIKGIAPKMDPAVQRERVEARLRRQERLKGENRPRYRLLLDEAVLYRPVGGPQVMAAQIGRILEMASEEKVTVQVIPFSIGAYPTSDIAFTLLEFSEPMLQPVVYVEGLASAQYYERPTDVARYREAVEDIRDSALSPRDSLKRMAEIRETYAGGQSPA